MSSYSGKSNLPRVTLHGFCPGFGMPDLSPFVFKVYSYLRLAGFPFEMISADSRKAPRQKLPFIEVNGQVVSDSTVILNHLEEINPNPLNGGIGLSDLAIGRLVQTEFEERLYFLLLCDRWKEESGWTITRSAVTQYAKDQKIPAPIRPFMLAMVRKSVIEQVNAQGAGRYSAEERIDLARSAYQALDQVLGDQPYFGGTQIRLVDCSAYAFLALAGARVFQTPIPELVRSFPRLTAYVDRMHLEVEKPLS